MVANSVRLGYLAQVLERTGSEAIAHRRSTDGTTMSWSFRLIFSCRANIARTAVICPPADRPPTEMLLLSMPYFSAFSMNCVPIGSVSRCCNLCLFAYDGRSTYELDHRPAIIDGNWKLVLRAKAVVNVNDFDTNVVAHVATPGLFRGKTSEDPTSAVHVEVRRNGTGLVGRVHADFDLACGIGYWNIHVLYTMDIWTFCPRDLALVEQQGAADFK
jgi:hypothetical protein